MRALVGLLMTEDVIFQWVQDVMEEMIVEETLMKEIVKKKHYTSSQYSENTWSSTKFLILQQIAHQYTIFCVMI